MPKKTLTFKLPEDAYDAALAEGGAEFHEILNEIRKEIRNHTKYRKSVAKTFQAICLLMEDFIEVY